MYLLADAVNPLSPPIASASSSEALFFYMFAAAVAFLLLNTVAVLTIIFFFKRNPPIEAEFATKTELKEGLDRVDNDIKALNTRNEALAAQIFAEIKAGNTSMNHEFSALNRSIGKLEGHQELALGIAEALRNK